MIVWVLLALGGSAAAQRVVAVVDATSGGDPEVAALVSDVGARLDQEAADVLVPVAAERRPALIGAMPEEDRAEVAEVAAALPRAREALTRFDDPAAIAAVDAGLALGAGLAPTPELVLMMADLVFLRGRAQLGRDVAAAERDFALVQRLDPPRTLDPVKHSPEVQAAYARAIKSAATATLDITAPDGAEVWIDGAEVGPAPASVTLGVGLHVVTVTGLRLLSRGQLVEVASTGSTVALDAPEASYTVIAHRLRARLIAAKSEFARTEAVAALTRLAGAQHAIVVGRHDGAVVAWFYSTRSDALGEPRTEPADELVKALRPPRIAPRLPPDCDDDEVLVGDECVQQVIIPTPTPWYRKRWVQATIGGALLTGVLTTVIAVVTRDPGDSMPIDDDNLVFGPPQ